MWSVFVIVYSDKVNKEIQRTGFVCYQILTEMPTTIEEGSKLLTLAEQASLTCPQISAGGVFNVNITTLCSLVGSLISYIIVFVPFDK